MEARTPRDPSEYSVRAIDRALDILEAFDDAHPSRGISEVAEAVGLHKATAYRIMTTLASRGYLERARDGQEYQLGMRLVTLGFQIVRRLDLPRQALPFMRQVSAAFDETLDLSVYDRGEILCIQAVRSRRVLALATSVGQHFPAHATATGKVVMAHIPEAEREALLTEPLTRFTTHTIVSPALLRAQIAAARDAGYASDDEEFEEGVRALAVPVLDQNGTLMAALSLLGPAFRLTEDLYPEMAQALGQAAQGIAVAMGWQAPA